MLVIRCPEVVERFGLPRPPLLFVFVLPSNYVEERAVGVYSSRRGLDVVVGREPLCHGNALEDSGRRPRSVTSDREHARAAVVVLDAQNRRAVDSLIHVADVVDAYLAVAEALDRPEVAGEAFNFASGAQVSVLDMVKTIAKLMGGQLPEPRVLNVAKNEIKEQRLSTDKAKRTLGWRSRVSLDDGLRATIEWYRSYLGTRQ